MGFQGLANDIAPIYGSALSDATRNDMLATAGADQYMTEQERAKQMGGEPGVKTMKSGGKVSSASKRADGAAIRGKTKGRIV